MIEPLIDEQETGRLAAMPPDEYERRRAREAKRLRVSEATLDAQVLRLRRRRPIPTRYQIKLCRKCRLSFLAVDFMPWRVAGFCSDSCQGEAKRALDGCFGSKPSARGNVARTPRRKAKRAERVSG